MISRLLKWVAGSLITFTLAVPLAMAGKNIVIGHFGNPTPMQVAAARGEFAKATGWDIEWRKFASGADVIAAMSKGEVEIAELGSAPLAVAAGQGVDLQIFMIAQVIGEAESLIVRDGMGIKKIEALKGRRIAVPFGSTAHFSLIGALHKAGLTEQDVTLINASPDQIVAAWQQQTIDAAFIWQPVQSRLLDTGRLLVSADKTAAWGYPTFDSWVVNRAFATNNSDKLAAFVKVMDAANIAYLKDPNAWTAGSVMVQAIAKRTGATPDQIPDILQGYTFLPAAKQIEVTRSGSAIARTITYTAGFLTAVGKIDRVAEDYSTFINMEPMQAAVK